MLEGNIFGLAEEPIEFISENHEDFLIVPSSKKYEKIYVEKDIVDGILYNNRNIKLFGCIYNGRYISCQGYACSFSNIEPDKLESFDRITFSGKSIDFFAGGSGRVMKKLEDGVDWEERAYALVPKKWEDICTKSSAVIDGIVCNIGITYCIKYNSEWGKREIGVCEPRFFIEFEEKVSIDMIPKVYLWVYDFMSFLNFRRNIEFDRIQIYKRVEMSEKYVQTGNVHIKGRGIGEFTNTENNSVIWSDIGDNISSLFGYIAERRYKNTADELFIPNSDKEYRNIGYTTFLQCALTFEGEYDRTQATKAETNEKFKRVKEVAQKASINAACEFFDNDDDVQEIQNILLEEIKNKFCKEVDNVKDEQESKSKKKIIEKYAKKILKEIEHVDFTLEEQFNILAKDKYKSIISIYQDRLAKRMGITIADNTNLGAIFAEMRNEIGHGHPPKLEDIHAFTCQLARCMVYIMILEKNNVAFEKIEKIVQKIFK